ncbi:hypothetical protein AZE99_12030 [Sphingorhabdus sp. M41]|nr:hypothetical protein AZE99_12030 [Sphingorhabdus sp. M41]
MFRIISAYRLLKSLKYLQKNDASQSRQYLDKVLGVHDKHFDFIVAFDAMVMGVESRHDESLKRFREARILWEEYSDPDSQYIVLFCRYWECILVEGGNCEKFKNQALGLDTGKRVRMFLRL